MAIAQLYRFGPILGIGTTKVLLNRLSIVYDTRNDLTVPSEQPRTSAAWASVRSS